MTIVKLPMWALVGVVAVLTIVALPLLAVAEIAPSGVRAPTAVPQSAQEPPGLAAGVLPAGTIIPEHLQPTEVESSQAEVSVSAEPSGVIAGSAVRESVLQESAPVDLEAAGVLSR
ncbi:MAG TPA: hypothetical protein VNP04_01700 [Alphaproteobacteria bacterium]|nr:hypothetical protein [Alphaproteobacteria bacterium]